MPSYVRSAAATCTVAGYLTLQWLGRSYGATRAERQRRLPGDDLMANPMAVTTHAITIDAPPERIVIAASVSPDMNHPISSRWCRWPEAYCEELPTSRSLTVPG